MLGLYFLFFFSALFFIVTHQKTSVHLFFNQYVGNKFFDGFYYYLTYLGDGRFAAIFLLLILFYNVRTGIVAITSFLISGIISNGLKYFFFDDVNRPFFIFTYFEHRLLNLVQGEDVHIHNSFPSGHATQAFAIFMVLVFTTQNKFLKFLYFSIAVLTAYSRVYLSQHWLNDITAGSFIGFNCSILCYYFIISRNKIPKLDHSLYSLRTEK